MNVGKFLDSLTGGTSEDKNVGGQQYTQHNLSNGQTAFSEEKNLGGYRYTEITTPDGQKIHSEQKSLLGYNYTEHR